MWAKIGKVCEILKKEENSCIELILHPLENSETSTKR
jgi:hypothetical protein